MTDELAERIARLSPEKRELLEKLMKGTDTAALKPYRAPESATEHCLAAIWREVFGSTSIGIDDDFFALGGDSILSIQIIAKAQRQGLRFTNRNLFDEPTIAQLAAFLERTRANSPDPFAHPEKLPVDHRLLRGAPAARMLLLRPTVPLSVDALIHAARTVLWGQPLLGVRFDTRQAQLRKDSSAGALEPSISVAAQDALYVATRTASSELSLTHGPLVRFIIGQSQQSAVAWLLVCAHPLIADMHAMKWLAAALDRECFSSAEPSDQTGALESVCQWLREHATGRSAADQPVNLVSAEPVRIPCSSAVPMNDVLLAALLKNLREHFGRSQWHVDLELSLRRFLPATLDASGLLASFNTSVPLTFEIESGQDLLGVLQAVKAQQRQLPRVSLSSQSAPCDLHFNYDGHCLQATALRGFELGQMPRTLPQGSRGVLQIDWSLSAGELQIAWAYDPSRYAESQITSCMQAFNATVHTCATEAADLLRRCVAAEDFPDAELSTEELQRLLAPSGGS